MRCISKDCYFMGINKICYCFIDFLYRYITCRILFCNGFRRLCRKHFPFRMCCDTCCLDCF